MGYQDCSAVQARHAQLRQEHKAEAEAEAEANRQRDVRKLAAAARQLATLRQRMRAAAESCIAKGIPISRASLREAGYSGHCGSMGALITELIDDGTIRKEHLHGNRTKRDDWQAPEPQYRKPKVDPEEQRVELPPLRSHAPEVPPANRERGREDVARNAGREILDERTLDWYRR